MTSNNWVTIIMIVPIIAIFYFMYRSQKKQEKQTNQMRDSLEVGDEITTIGGIVGEIVSLRDETVTIETSKDRTKIRILRSAVRNVDVYAAEKNGTAKDRAEAEAAKIDKNTSEKKKKKLKEKVKNPQVAEEVVTEEVPQDETAVEETTEKTVLNGEEIEK